MRDIPLQFGEWLPDHPAFKNPGLTEAVGCYPGAGGYSPFFMASKQGAVTTEMIIGAEMFFDISASPVVVSGSSTRLCILRSGVVTETAGLSTSTQWRFARFNDLVIAVSPENAPQHLSDINSVDTWSPLPGAPPTAAQVGRVDDYLVFGDLTDNADGGNAVVPSRVRWSAKNNPTASWITDRGELSGFRDLPREYGRVTAIAGGRFGLVFQERAIHRMVFVGAPRGFEFEPVAVDRGCVAPGSAVTIGTDTFFLSQDGFEVCNGASSTSIGANRVSEWFSKSVNEQSLSSVHGAINWPARSIVWTFKSGGSATFGTQMIYNFVLDRWSSSEEDVHYLVKFKISGETLGSLANSFASLGGASAYTLGSQDFLPRDFVFGGFVEEGSGSDFALFSGDAVRSTFVTGEHMIIDGRRSEVTGVWPVIETFGEGVTASVRSRSAHGGAVSTTPATGRGADGYCPSKVDNWLHSIRVSVDAGVTWDNAQSVNVRAQSTGRR